MSSRDLAEKPDNVQSPLHRLQAEIAKDMNHGFSRSPHLDYREDNETYAPQESETASIYSFDSVSTNGRLLDRLDLESEDFSDAESILRRRESTISIQSTGRLLDRLGLDDSPEETAHNPFNSMHAPRDAPIRVNSSIGLERMRSANKAPSRSQSQNSRAPLKSAPHNIVQPRKNVSYDSLNVELSSGQGSSLSLQSLANISSSSLPGHLPMRQGSSTNVKKYPMTSPIQEGFDISSNPGSSASSPSLNQKLFVPTTHDSSPELSPEISRLVVQPSTKRTVSSSSHGSATSLEITNYFFSPSTRFDNSIEAATNKAIQIRLQGNPRESSYRLKLLADNPVNYPRAMYQYSQALWNGHGVKLSEPQGVRWLCRCILASFILESTDVEGSGLSNYMPKFADMSIEKMIKLIHKNISNETHDVFSLTTKFQAMPPTAISKIIQLNSTGKNTVGGAYYLLGECHSTGRGSVAKNELISRVFLAKSASLGYSEAMKKLGELWCNKSKAYKKDLHQAAAWLRLGETFDKKDIGNSWIYKEKYMAQKKK